MAHNVICNEAHTNHIRLNIILFCVYLCAMYSMNRIHPKEKPKERIVKKITCTRTHGERRSSHSEIERDAHINYHYPLSEQIKLHEE